jgi:hypothetical protein
MAPRTAPSRTRPAPRRIDDAVTLFARLDSNKWLIGLVFAGLVNTGIMYQQFNQIKETLASNTADQKVNSAQMNAVQIQQVSDRAEAQIIKAGAAAMEQRVRSLEVMFMETPKRREK